MEWYKNIENEVGYLENKDNYISINSRVNETALRVKFSHNGSKLRDYKTFIVMGNHKEVINKMSSDLEIMEWFAKNVNGFWSNEVELLEEYISNNFIK